MKALLALFSLLFASAPSIAGYGFVWANDMTAAPLVPYLPATAYSYNSSGHPNTVIRYWAGYYEVRMPMIMGAARNGNVQVTAYGSDDAYCKLQLWERRATSNMSAFVRCFNGGGVPVDSRFTLVYFDDEINPLDVAYARLDNPNPHTWPEPTCCYTPSAAWWYNARSPGDPIGDLHFWHEAASHHLAHIHGWPELEANVILTAVGGSTSRCALSRMVHERGTPSGEEFEVQRHAFWVLCARPVEDVVHDAFSLAYVNERTFGAGGAYLTSSRDVGEAWRVPPANRSANTFGGGNMVRSTGPGLYVARLGNLAGRYSRSTALVTAVTDFDAWCKVRNWSANGPHVDVSVGCFERAGQPAVSGFSLHFVTTP